MNEYFHFPLPLSRHFSTFPSLPLWITTDIAIDLCRKQKDDEDRPLQYKRQSAISKPTHRESQHSQKDVPSSNIILSLCTT
jgi:hypothetical protein